MSTSFKVQHKFTNEDVIQSIKIVMEGEGFSKTAYPDPFSPLGIELKKGLKQRNPGWQLFSGSPWTIGYGRTGPDVRKESVTTKDQEVFWLKHRIEEELVWLQQRGIPPCAGLVSLIYNIGKGAFSKSQAYKSFQEGRWDDGLREMQGFNKAGGKVRPGLVKRRAKEAALVKEWLVSRDFYTDSEA